MSERIKRYDLDIKVNIDIQDGELTAPPTASKTEVESPTGRFCLSTDVAAIEAENARLRRIVEAGDKMHSAIREGGSDTRLRETARAFASAKAQAAQQGEKGGATNAKRHEPS